MQVILEGREQGRQAGSCFIIMGMMLVRLENSGKQCASELSHSRVGIWGICTPAPISHWLNAAGNLRRGEELVHWPAIQARHIPRENGFCAGGYRGRFRHRGKGTGSCKFSVESSFLLHGVSSKPVGAPCYSPTFSGFHKRDFHIER